MGLCAKLIESKTEEQVYERRFPRRSNMYWVQPGNQSVGDQIFDSFAYSDSKPGLKKYVTSWKVTDEKSSTNILIWVTVFTTTVGFFCQFLGLRACHSSVAVIQLLVTFAMSLARAALRTERLSKRDNFMEVNPDLIPGHELDYLALEIGKFDSQDGENAVSSDETQCWKIFKIERAASSDQSHETKSHDSRRRWRIFSHPHNDSPNTSTRSFTAFQGLEGLPSESPDSGMLFEFRTKEQPSHSREALAEKDLLPWILEKYGAKPLNNAAKAFFYRARLARMTGPEQPLPACASNWDAYITVRETSAILAEAIEDTMQILFSTNSISPVKLHSLWDQACAIMWSVQCSFEGPPTECSQIPMSLRRAIDHHGAPEGPWKADRSELEAVLGLWVWSLTEPLPKQPADRTESKTIQPSISRILSTVAKREDATHAIMDLDIWRDRGGFNIQQHNLKREPQGTPESELDQAVQASKAQNAVWWKDGEEFVFNGSPPGNARNCQRFFGWHNGETTSFGDSLHVLAITSKNSLLVNCAQEIYSKFLAAIMQAVEDFGGKQDCRKTPKGLIASNTNLKLVQDSLTRRGLCDQQDAFACTVPILRTHGKLQLSESFLAVATELADEYRRGEEWLKLSQTVGWLHDLFPESNSILETTTELRTALIQSCENYRKACLRDDRDSAEDACEGIIQLMKQFCREGNLKNIPFIWDDCGVIPPLPNRESARRLTLHDAIRCYGAATLRYVRQEESLRDKAKPLESELGNDAHTSDQSNLLQAIQECDLGSTLYLLERNTLCPSCKTEALFIASKNGWYTVVGALEKLGANVNAEDSDGRTALSYASELGDVNMVDREAHGQ